MKLKVVTFNLVNVILVNKLVASIECSLSGEMFGCKVLYIEKMSKILEYQRDSYAKSQLLSHSTCTPP